MNYIRKMKGMSIEGLAEEPLGGFQIIDSVNLNSQINGASAFSLSLKYAKIFFFFGGGDKQ